MNTNISVIIPVYNVERYLEECLDSVIRQNRNDVEIICIDDGSTDSSPEILRNYENRFNFIKVITQKNSGQGTARNLALKKANGKYIYFLDSDDYLAENSLNIAFDECEKHNLDLLCFNAVLFYENDYNGNYGDNLDRENFIKTSIASGSEILKQACSNNCFRTEAWMNFYRKDLLINNNILFSESRIYEDIIQVFKSFILAKKARYIDDKLIYRRVRNGSAITSGLSAINSYGYSQAATDLYSILNDNINNLDSEAIFLIKEKIALYFKRSLNISDSLDNLALRNEISSLIPDDVIDLDLDILINAKMLSYIEL